MKHNKENTKVILFNFFQMDFFILIYDYIHPHT